MLMQPAAVFEMPNIFRPLTANTTQPGKGNILRAICQLFQQMREPNWKKMTVYIPCVVEMGKIPIYPPDSGSVN